MSELQELVGIIRPLMNILFVLVPILIIGHVTLFIVSRLRYYSEESISTPTPTPLVPSKAIAKMLNTIAGEEIPEWVETLGQYEKQGILAEKVQKSISKLEEVFQKEIKQFNENFTAFQGLKVKEDASLILDLTERLKKQKELVLEVGQEILALRIQDEAVNSAYKADKLAKKMDKELSGRQVEIERVRETVIETVRSVEEQVLRDILSSADATTDMKERAGQLLPHFKGETKEEKQQEVKRMDYELDLQTIERIVESRVALDEKVG